MRTLILRLLLTSLIIGSFALCINIACDEYDFVPDLCLVDFDRFQAYLPPADALRPCLYGSINTASELKASIILYLERHEKSPPRFV